MKGLAHLGIFAASSERHYARRASEQMLDLFHKERREHPDLTGWALYEAVAAQRLGDKPRMSATEVVKRAEESFTDWPVERPVRFRDVVHYLVFDEYMHSGKAREATKTNMGAVVARIIPEEL